MPKSKVGFAKSLKGNAIDSLIADAITDSSGAGSTITNTIIAAIGDINLSNVDIDGGTIDGVIIGGDEPPVITSSTLTVGSNGNGATVTFYCGVAGKRMFWDTSACKLTVFGSFRVTDTTESLELGDTILIAAGAHDTITTSSGDLKISPVGSLVLTTAIDHDTTTGDVTFNTTGGLVDIHGQTGATFRSTAGDIAITATGVTNDVNITAGATSGDINLTGTVLNNHLNLKGDIYIPKAKIDPTSKEASAKVLPSDVIILNDKTKDELKSSLDIMIKLGNQVVVSSKQLYARLVGQLNLINKPNQPLLGKGSCLQSPRTPLQNQDRSPTVFRRL